jgi:hypothetical protein
VQGLVQRQVQGLPPPAPPAAAPASQAPADGGHAAEPDDAPAGEAGPASASGSEAAVPAAMAVLSAQLRGVWRGTYGRHGFEMLTLSSPAPGVVTALKLTGGRPGRALCTS